MEGFEKNNLPPRRPNEKPPQGLSPEKLPLLNEEANPAEEVEALRRALRVVSIKNALEARMSGGRQREAEDVDFAETTPTSSDDSGFADTVPTEFPTLTTVVEGTNDTEGDAEDTHKVNAFAPATKTPRKGFFKKVWGGILGGTRWVGKQLARYQAFTEDELLTLNKQRYGNRGNSYTAQYQKNNNVEKVLTHEVIPASLPDLPRIEQTRITTEMSHIVEETSISPITQPYIGTKEGRTPVWEEPVRDSTLDDPRPFLESLYPKNLMAVSEHAQTRNESMPAPITIERAFEKLAVIDKNTENIRTSLLERLGTHGKEFLSLVDKGSKFFKENVSWKTRVFAGAGLLTSAALSVYAAPLVLTALGVTSLSMRVISASGTYLVLKNVLDKNFDARTKNGKAASEKEKMFYGVGAVILAGITGQAIGHLIENGIPQSVRDMFQTQSPLPATPPATIEVPAETPVDTPVESTTPEAIVPAPVLLHEVVKGDSLWSILRSSLSQENFEGFTKLTLGDQEKMIQLAVNKIAEDPTSYGVTSGSVHKLGVGNMVKFSLPELFKE